MNTAQIPVYLPPVRKQVFRHSLRIIALYIVVGIFMTAAVFVASDITPKAIHLNYDSISAATKMDRAWSAIADPSLHPEHTVSQWSDEFDQALGFEKSNITENGEAELAKNIEALWLTDKPNLSKIPPADFIQMESNLDRLVSLNEKGMFAWADESYSLRQKVLLITISVFVVTIFLAFYMADSLAVKIASPLRELSAALKRKPDPGTKLKMPETKTLEMRVLSGELLSLWQRVSDLQKLNLEEISSQRTHLETVLASVEDAILVLDNHERIIHCNAGMLSLLNTSLGGVINHPWGDLSLMSSNYVSLRNSLSRSITSDQMIELELNDQQRVYSGRFRPILSEKNKPIGTLYLLHDITEIKQKDRLRTEFIGVLSHELKTPLQSLGTAAELLLKRKDSFDDDERMLIETIHEDAGRIRGVANEFVQVGLVDLHSLRLKMEPVVINQLLTQWVQPFQILAKDKDIKLEVLKEGSESINARIDPVKFPWAVTNLLSNAIRVSPPHSKILVSISDRERKIHIEISDEGPGIPEGVQKRMFESFFQGKQPGDDKTAGFLGLGLTITKEVVEAHDGTIEYFSRRPTGSTFRISLPIMI